MYNLESFRSRYETEVPDWAPTITCAADLAQTTMIKELDFGYQDMSNLLRKEIVSKKNLKTLHIHLASQYKLGQTNSQTNGVAWFLSNSLLNSSMGPGYFESMQKAIPGLTVEDIAQKSFIIVSVEDLLKSYSVVDTDIPEVLRHVVLHEMLHFTEFVKTRKKKEKTLGAVSALGLKHIFAESEIPGEIELINEFNAQQNTEEGIVIARTAKLINSRGLKNLVLASLVKS